MKTGVIMIALGGPRSLDEIPDFVRGLTGKNLPPSAMQDIIERYRRIGGSSPLIDITSSQAEALGHRLGSDYLCLPAFRYSHPTIEDVMGHMVEAGVSIILGFPLSPYYTSITIGSYMNRMRQYMESHSLSMPLRFIHSWHREPKFIASWAEKLRTESFDAGAWYLFSAHSLPMTCATEPYVRQIEETVQTLSLQTSILFHSLGWQSIPATARERWITPTVEERLADIASKGFARVVQVPIGFTADHVETLYDIDILHHTLATKVGLAFRRISSLNNSPTFIEALETLVRRCGDDDGHTVQALRGVRG